MNAGTEFQWYLMLYPLAVVAYFELIKRLDRYWIKRTKLTDEEILTCFARASEISEFEVFKMAAPDWSVPPSKIEEDFTAYLKEGILPHYLRDFIRRLRKESNFKDNEPPCRGLSF
jgi:hypothetical protein